MLSHISRPTMAKIPDSFGLLKHHFVTVVASQVPIPLGHRQIRNMGEQTLILSLRRVLLLLVLPIDQRKQWTYRYFRPCDGCHL